MEIILKTQKITQEILDNSVPQKPPFFTLKRWILYLITYIIISVFGMIVWICMNACLLHSLIPDMGVFKLSFFLGGFITLILLLQTESFSMFPKFMLRICGLKEYSDGMVEHGKLEEEFEQQQKYFELHGQYKDLL